MGYKNVLLYAKQMLCEHVRVNRKLGYYFSTTEIELTNSEELFLHNN